MMIILNKLYIIKKSKTQQSSNLRLNMQIKHTMLSRGKAIADANRTVVSKKNTV